MEGYWNDWTGASRKIKVKAETLDGRYVIYWQPMGLLLVSKDEVKVECYERESQDKTMGQCKNISELEVLTDISKELAKLNSRLGSLGQTLSIKGG